VSDPAKKAAASGNSGPAISREDVRVEKQYIPMPIGFSAYDLILFGCLIIAVLATGIQIGRALAAGGE
jgi:hypothetical protein